jgi:hypothetical protein
MQNDRIDLFLIVFAPSSEEWRIYFLGLSWVAQRCPTPKKQESRQPAKPDHFFSNK